MSNPTDQTNDGLSRKSVWTMFDRIAPRYDLLNRLLSFRRDVAWRKHMAKLLKDRQNIRLLDVATGTGDQILHLIDAGADIREATGIDMAEEMLKIGRTKLRSRNLEQRVSLQTGDATHIPIADASVDAATISFGIRNVEDVVRGLSEMRRVLVPGGCALVLEFSMPRSAVMRAGYLFYLRWILPGIGGLLSGDRHAYRYLNRTIETFPHGDAFCALMREAGLTQTEAIPLTFGVATIYKGIAPAA